MRTLPGCGSGALAATKNRPGGGPPTTGYFPMIASCSAETSHCPSLGTTAPKAFFARYLMVMTFPAKLQLYRSPEFGSLRPGFTFFQQALARRSISAARRCSGVDGTGLAVTMA